jgi:hypothetical protein
LARQDAREDAQADPIREAIVLNEAKPAKKTKSRKANTNNRRP